MTSTILTVVDEVRSDCHEQLAQALQAARAANPPAAANGSRPLGPNNGAGVFGSVPGLHFGSVVAFNASDNGKPRQILVVELNFDGTVDSFLPGLLKHAG